MANTKSAKKALRVSSRRHEINLSRKWKIKNSLKELRRVLVADTENYQTALDKAFSALDKAKKSNLLHPKKADRKKSRLSKMVAKAQLQKES